MSTLPLPLTLGQSFKKVFSRESVLDTARRCGFLQRQRDLDVFLFTLVVVLGAVSEQRRSYGQMAADIHALGGALVTPQNLGQRLNSGVAVDLLSDLGCQLIEQLAQKTLGPQALPDWLSAFPAIWATDSTIMPLAPILASQWPGSGGSASAASLKGHFTMEAWGGSTWTYRLTQGNLTDSIIPVIADAPQGTLHLVDQGYSKSLPALYQVDQAKQYFLTPLWLNSRLYTQAGERLDLMDMIRRNQAVGQVDETLWLGPPDQPGSLSIRLVGYRLPEDVVERRRRRVRKEAQRKQRVPKEQTLALKSWMFFLTNVPASMLPPPAVASLYRLRWQIELLFKRFKSLLGMRKMALYEGEAALNCQVLAGLLAALLLDEVQEAAYHAWNPSVEREPSLYRMTALLIRLGPLLAWALGGTGDPLQREQLLQRILANLWALGRMERRKRRSTRQALLELDLEAPLFSTGAVA